LGEAIDPAARAAKSTALLHGILEIQGFLGLVRKRADLDWRPERDKLLESKYFLQRRQPSVFHFSSFPFSLAGFRSPAMPSAKASETKRADRLFKQRVAFESVSTVRLGSAVFEKRFYFLSQASIAPTALRQDGLAVTMLKKLGGEKRGGQPQTNLYQDLRCKERRAFSTSPLS